MKIINHEGMRRETTRRNFLKAASLGMAGLGVIDPAMTHATEYPHKGSAKKVEMAIATIRSIVM